MDFLRVSDNGRYFVRGGKPFFWLGDTVWPAVSWFSMEELEVYFSRRAEQGFTVEHIMLPWASWDGIDGTQDFTMRPGEMELWLNDNPDTPNEAFFEKLDQVIELAGKHGLLLTIMPNGGSGGMHVEYRKILTMKNVRNWGKWLGRRYRDEPNIVWVNGFDVPPWVHEDIAIEFNAGLFEEDCGNHLMFYHPCGGTTSSHFHNEDWLAANFIQTWGFYDTVQSMVTADYHRNPTKPVVHVEGAYEAGTEFPTVPITSWHVREQAYWAFLSGGFHTYGHGDVWRKTPYWKDTLDAKGSWQMKILKDFFTSLQWWKLVPDPKLYHGMGVERGFVGASSSDGDFAVLYYPYRWVQPVNIGRFGGGKPVTGEWMDPQTGKWLSKAVYTGEVCNITSPAQCDDAILLLKVE